jgi:hypothetical protein
LFAERAGVTQLAESQPSKLLVAGSIPVARSIFLMASYDAHVAQLAERVLGKDEVSSSILLVGSTLTDTPFFPRRRTHVQAEI